MPRLTRGFSSPTKLARHFQKHGAEVGAKTQAEYESRADVFLGSPLTPPVQECSKANGDLARYNRPTKEFGILDDARFIVTYYLLAAPTVRARDAYFLEDCGK